MLRVYIGSKEDWAGSQKKIEAKYTETVSDFRSPWAEKDCLGAKILQKYYPKVYVHPIPAAS